jgi:transposase
VSATDRIAQLEARVEALLAKVDRLEARVEELEGENAELRKENVALKAKNAELEEKLGKSSRNSSKPPSSDSPKEKAERPTKKPTGRAAGGQPGHPKHERPAWPPEKVAKQVILLPKRCEKCATPLVGEDSEPRRHQVFELPKIEPIVTEFVQHSLGCPCCGHMTRAPLPPGVPKRVFGPSVDAVASYFMGVHGIGKRGVAEALYDLYGLPISVGAVVGSQQQTSEALAQPYAEIVAHAQAAPIKNADETSWVEGKGKKARAWLWTLVTASAIVFMIQKTRATKGAANLLLNGKTRIVDLVFGVLGTDRHGAYNFWPLALHQFCWSHLTRDFTAISERPGAAGDVGRKLLEEKDRMFAWWHRVRDGTLSRASFRVYMRPLRARVEAILVEGIERGDKKTARTCAKLLKSSEAMWTFVRIEGVEPTNNSGERAVRHGVIYRKLSGGTKSEAGSRFVERILTAHATLRLQNRPILPFLQAACEARLRGSTPPSLLPTASSESRESHPRLRMAA